MRFSSCGREDLFEDNGLLGRKDLLSSRHGAAGTGWSQLKDTGESSWLRLARKWEGK